jgi:hypothetical protein
MIALLLRLVALILFVVAALNETLFSQPPADLVAWGLAAWVLSTLVGDPIILARVNRQE